MKNILGTQEDLRLYNKSGIIVYKFIKARFYFFETTHNSNGNVLTYKNSSGYSYEKTYDKNGNQLTYKGSNGYSYEKTYNENGKVLTFKDSNGFSWEKTYGKNGMVLTFRDSNFVERGFDIPEFTMKQLVDKVGNFKLIK